MVNLARVRLEVLAVTLVAAGGAWAWSLLNGRDLNWDFLNYHLYAGFAADGSRLWQDYFPASIQSYMPGYAYVPLALAVMANWDAWKVQLLLGSMGMPAVLSVWLLAYRLIPDAASSKALGWRMLAVAAACSSPLFAAELGTSFADLPTATLILFALALALPDPVGRQPGRPWAAGTLCGLACALKLSNPPMVVGMIVVCGIVAKPGERMRACVAFAGSAALAFVLVYGLWGWQLMQRFGNPFFPVFLNQWVGSDEFAQASVVVKRFIPDSVLGFWLRPLYMLDPVPGVYVETRAPDARYLALLIAIAVTGVIRKRLTAALGSPLMAILAWVGITWALWLVSSGNGRYGIALAMGSGVALAALTRILWSVPHALASAAKVSFVAFIAIQALFLGLSTNFRWDGRESPDREYFKPSVPAQLQSAPHVIVSLQSQSLSWLAPFVHPQSVFTAPAGQHLFNPMSTAGQRVAALFVTGLPILVAVDKREEIQFASAKEEMLVSVARLFGLQVDLDQCLVVDMGRMDVSFGAGDPAAPRIVKPGYSLCRARFDPQLSTQARTEAAMLDDVFNLVEDACPAVLGPRRQQTACVTGVCARRYVNTDVVLLIDESGTVMARRFGAVQPVIVGHSSQLRAGSRPQCPERVSQYIPFSAGDGVIARSR